MAQGGSFIPGEQINTDTSTESAQNSSGRETLFNVVPWGTVIGALLIIGIYVGAMYAVEYFVLDRKIASLKDTKAQLESQNSDIWPRKGSVPTFLASVNQLARTQADIPSLLSSVSGTEKLTVNQNSIFYARDANVLEMQASVPSLEALNNIQRRLKENKRITAVDISDITELSETGRREFTVRLVLQ